MSQASLISNFDYIDIRQTDLFWPALIKRPPFRDDLVILSNQAFPKISREMNTNSFIVLLLCTAMVREGNGGVVWKDLCSSFTWK